MELTCPKCQGTMRTYESNGVHVDQCTECRGIFLDRGELERLTEAESRWQGTAAAATHAQHPPSRPAHAQPPGRGGYPQKRRKSFLEELFD